jgi:Tfp pilus assembly protein PilF
MRRVSSFSALAACLFVSSCLFCSSTVTAQQGAPLSLPDIGERPVRGFSVSGSVSDANHVRLDGVRLELHAFGGPAVGTVFTSGNGNFQFNNVPAGNYTLVTDQVGYQTANQQVEVRDSSVFGVQVELLKTLDGSTPVNMGPNTISKRELSIPHKAHDSMGKGLDLLYEKSDFQGSLKLFQKAIEGYPDYYEAYAQMGVAYMKLADADNSEKAFRKSIEVSHEQYPMAYIGLTDNLLNENRFADAEPMARKAIELDSNSWQANSQLARALVELHRPAEAEASAVAAAKLRPDNATLYLILANVHIQLQNNRALLDDLNHYLQLAPVGPFADRARQQRDQLQQALDASQRPPAAASPTQP